MDLNLKLISQEQVICAIFLSAQRHRNLNSPLFNLEKCFQRKETKNFQFPIPFSLEMEAQKTLISFPSIWTNVSKGWNQLSLFCIGRFLDLDFHFRNHLLFFSESFSSSWICLLASAVVVLETFRTI